MRWKSLFGGQDWLVTSKEDKETEGRLSKANKYAKAMRVNHLIRVKQLSTYNYNIFVLQTIIIRPTALYGCESWVLNKSMKEN